MFSIVWRIIENVQKVGKLHVLSRFGYVKFSIPNLTNPIPTFRFEKYHLYKFALRIRSRNAFYSPGDKIFKGKSDDARIKLLIDKMLLV